MSPLTLVLYGPSGSGKTSFAGNFPNCKFLCDSQERGAEFLARRNLIPEPVSIDCSFTDAPESFPLLLQAIYDTVTEKEVDTLVLESLTGIENIMFLHHCEKKFNGNFDGTKDSGGFFDYARGPKSAARLVVPKLLDALDTVYQSGKHVIFTAHSGQKEEASAEGINVLKHVPYADKDVWARIHKWASGVFFLGKKIEVDRSAKGLRSVAKEEFDRIMYTEGTPYCEAKNWHGLKGVINMGMSGEEAYQNFLKKMG